MKRFLIISLLLFIISTLIHSQSWKKQNPSVPSNAFVGPFSTVNEKICWASWSTSWGSDTQFKNGYLRTTDGGETWFGGEIPETEFGIILWIEALSADTAFFTVENWAKKGVQGLYKTTDGGITWAKHHAAYANSPLGPGYIHFFDSKNGVVVGEQNGGNGFQIFTTTNAGTNWNEVPQTNIPPVYPGEVIQTTPMAEFGDCIWLTTFPSPGHGPRILKTTDRGYHWSIIELPGLNDTQILSVAFQDENTGLVVIASPKISVIQKTTDGGNTWKIVQRPYGCSPVFISYIPGTKSGYLICGDVNFDPVSGGSAYTLNGGSSWTEIDNGNYIEPYFVSPNVGWCSQWGTNNVYKISGSITSVSEFGNKRIINSYSLEQNFPNPFNPSTTIKYKKKERDNVKIIILNTIGEEISTILNEEKEPGEYQIKFDASAIPSGVYFYRINAGSYTSVKKMLLLK